MEPPRKRQRLSPHSPNDVDLQIARARNNQKLKSLFEGIFEKYGKDFSDIGDEIDLQTGEIVVNKGHVQRMEHEDDTGELTGAESEDEEETSHNEQDGTEAWDTSFQKARKALLNSGNKDPEAATEIPPDELPVSRPTDPKWQAPEIDANFWRTPKKELPKEVHQTPRAERPKSSPSATSVWAVRTPGRPPGSTSKKESTSKKQSVSTSKKTPSVRAKPKRKSPLKLDWSFARVQDEDSDSDDPLQDDSLPSSIRSNKVRGRESSSVMPKALNVISNNMLDTTPKRQGKADSGKNIRHAEQIKPVPDTPELLSSSPAILYETPTHRRYPVNFDSPSTIKLDEVILTPDEVKVIVKFKCESATGLCMEDIVKHLPGRTFDDLLNWADHHSLLFLSNGSVTTAGWSTDDLEKLDEFADEAGIWWRDIQISLPHRSRKEIEKQMIRIWTERKLEELQQKKDEEAIELARIERKQSQTPYSDDNDPALRMVDVMTNDNLEDPLEEELDNDWSSISAIGVRPRETGVFDSSPRKSPQKLSPMKGSPRKSSVSPRKYY
ncbi:hypothetical protein ZTR_11183 [Talaromyces verruculosus]|nr:hypothetical protein ZTR_11183 [Talaromyces verruculosus]